MPCTDGFVGTGGRLAGPVAGDAVIDGGGVVAPGCVGDVVGCGGADGGVGAGLPVGAVGTGFGRFAILDPSPVAPGLAMPP
jgi:hypothetical protein